MGSIGSFSFFNHRNAKPEFGAKFVWVCQISAIAYCKLAIFLLGVSYLAPSVGPAEGGNTYVFMDAGLAAPVNEFVVERPGFRVHSKAGQGHFLGMSLHVGLAGEN